MDDPQVSLPSLGIGDLIGRSLRLLITHFGFLFPIAFVPALIATVIGQFADGQTITDDLAPLQSSLPGPAAFLAIAVSIFISFLVTGVMCLAALDALFGKRHTVGEYLRQTTRHIAPIVLVGALVYVAAGFAAILLLVPGLYILARYLPWTPAIVFENSGWAGLARAQELTVGYRWPLVASVTIIGLIIVSLMFLLAPIAIAGGTLVDILVEATFTGIYYALISIFSALVYVRLREIREGATITDLAAGID